MQPGRRAASCPDDFDTVPSSFGYADCNYLTNRDAHRNTPSGAYDGDSYRRTYSQSEGTASHRERYTRAEGTASRSGRAASSGECATSHGEQYTYSDALCARRIGSHRADNVADLSLPRLSA